MKSTPSYTTQRLDHLGIVSGICRKIHLVELIDSCFPDTNAKRFVSVGEATLAFILNALGFVSRPLYLTPEFFHNKPLSLLIREGLSPDDFNDDLMGRTLDILFEGGLTELFAYLASHALDIYGISYKGMHLDTTSLSFYGKYPPSPETSPLPEDSQEETSQVKPIEITYGHSKDFRPDLKQAVVSLITLHQSALPVWIQVLDGNTSDKVSLPQSIENYIEQLGLSSENYFILDSAFYTAENISEYEEIGWISRVPETIKEAKVLLSATSKSEMQEIQGLEGYWIKSFKSHYAGVAQRWIVVFSEKAYEREIKTFETSLKKASEKASSELKKLSKIEFACEADAREAAEKLQEKWKYHQAEVELTEVVHYRGAGRPKKGGAIKSRSFQVNGKVRENGQAIEKGKTELGKFIVASNLPEEKKSAEEVLKEYKGQGSAVERGFRFLKDPMFFANGMYLKKPSRIMALIMIMGLSLLVYSLAEREIRKQLKERKESVPDQKGKATQQITVRRVFQMFEGIDVLLIPSPEGQKRLILNLSELHQQILCLLGPEVQRYYFSSA